MPKEQTGWRVYSEAQSAIAEISGYYAIIPEELVYSHNLPALAVYAVLDRIAKHGDGFASMARLAQDTGMSQARVRRARDWLVEQDFIRIVRKGDGRLSTDYSLPFQTKQPRGTISDSPGVSPRIYQPEPLTKDNKSEPLLDIKQQPLDPTVWPEWYSDLYSLPGFKADLEHCRKWLADNNITEAQANQTAAALRGRWDGKKYKDAWATFRNWVQRPLPGGQQAARPSRQNGTRTADELKQGWGRGKSG